MDDQETQRSMQPFYQLMARSLELCSVAKNSELDNDIVAQIVDVLRGDIFWLTNALHPMAHLTPEIKPFYEEAQEIGKCALDMIDEMAASGSFKYEHHSMAYDELAARVIGWRKGLSELRLVFESR
jgi:hypothetical protein